MSAVENTCIDCDGEGCANCTSPHSLILHHAKESLRIARILCRDADTAFWSDEDHYILTQLRDALESLDAVETQ